MMFDLGSESDALLEDAALVPGLQNELDVSITIKPKARHNNKAVIVKAQERNAAAMYRVRTVLLGLDPAEATKATIPDTYNIRAAPASSSAAAPGTPGAGGGDGAHGGNTMCKQLMHDSD